LRIGLTDEKTGDAGVAGMAGITRHHFTCGEFMLSKPSFKMNRESSHDFIRFGYFIFREAETNANGCV
jgi:hypothetical protein